MNQSTIAADAEAVAPHALTMLRVGWIALALSMLGLGLLGFVSGDFALNWQPVPAWVPGRTLLAYLTATLFLALGAGLLVDRYKHSFALATAAAFLVWAVLLHGPAVVANPLSILPWLGFTERLEVAAGALMLAATQVPGTVFAGRAMLAGRIAFGACLPIFGLSHFAYAQFTADMIPAYIPAHLFFAYLAGAGHIAAGVAILSSLLTRAAAIAFAAMVSGIVVLLHIPRAIADPGNRTEWTMLVIATTISAAAWCMAGSVARKDPLAH